MQRAISWLKKHLVAALLVMYGALRALSFVFFHSSIGQGIVVVLIVSIMIACFIRRQTHTAWAILLGEFILGGNGHLFELFGLALRTWLVGIFLLLWFWRDRKKILPLSEQFKPLWIPLVLLALSVAGGIGFGLLYHHPLQWIVQDATPFIFILLLFPALEYAADTKKYCIPIIQTFILGEAIFSLFTLALFSTGMSRLEDPFYHWFRDVIGGKITDLSEHFFRIVAPEHLLLPAIVLFLAAILMKEKKKALWGWMVLALLPLALNVSRTYDLAIIGGLLLCSGFFPFKRWLTISLVTIALGLGLFAGIHLIASRGASLGFDVFQDRFVGIVNPDEEASSAARVALLSPIWQKINAHPILGSGFGETITYTKNHISTATRAFDWGYLEIWAKMGTLGLLATGLLLWKIAQSLVTQARQGNLRSTGFLAGLVVIAIITVTGPGLYHIFGIFFLIVCLVALPRDGAWPAQYDEHVHNS